MLYKKLKSAREESGLTQSEVAKKLYVTRQTVSRWEQGKTLPNIYVIQKLSNLYCLSLDELVENTVFEKEEVKNMKKINFFALFGALVFNIFLFSLVILFLSGILILSYGISLIMIFSPLIFVVFVLTGIQDFNVFQLILTIFFIGIGLFSIPLLKKSLLRHLILLKAI
ncbi:MULTISPECIES: helix-turn-helix transcriptional regulator [Staphylococcus]|uniref:Helix-turn-helix transcriptional regulator n=1 Tax=Staphylococcus hsinchuensis TaxID=3051183 RepID=A0ABZ3EE49_9STAP|nr:helix-turn-helix transcriptional regulator [Staphylococcus sp. Marseille-Q6910]